MTSAEYTVPAPPIADSPYVRAKAAALPVRYEGRGRFAVASGTTPGVVYYVQAPRGEREPIRWRCSCDWSRSGGALCSHVRAADRELARLELRRRLRAEKEARA